MEDNKDVNCISDEVTVTLPHFENIRKATLGETYQYFRNILKNKSIKNVNECVSISSELSLFDESLRLLLIDSLQLENEVLKILLSQNEHQVKRVLEFKWFFQNLPAEICTKQILPYVSFSVRCKIINRLSRHLESTEEAEKYFAFIGANYGNSRADCILPRCSSQFILAYVEKKKPMFDYNNALRTFLNICKRYPEIGVYILSTIFDNKEKFNFYSYKKIMHYLIGYHLDLMVPFVKKHNSQIPQDTFGRKLTKKLVGKLKNDLFPDVIEHLIFKEITLFSMISFEEQARFIAALVRSSSNSLSSRSWTSLDHRLACLLKLVSQDKRQELINSAFKEVYNVDFLEHPKCWSCEVLETLPTETRVAYVEKLEKFAEAGINVFRKNVGYNCFSPDKQENFLYLYDARRAFEKFREILKKSPAPNKRETVLIYLVKSCGINKDLEVLEEVVEFVVKHHRNDDNSVIFNFMEAICDNFPVSTLNASIFEKVDDLAYYCNLKGRRNDSVYNEWKERHIHYRLENDLNVDTHLKSFFQSALIKSYRHTFVRDLRRKHSKNFILSLCKEAVSYIQNKSNDETNGDFLLGCLLDTCKEYNGLNKNNRIFLREIPGLEEILKEKNKKIFGDVGGEDWPLDIWETYYNDVSHSYDKAKFLFYIFKRKPKSIENHLKGILKILLSFPHYLNVQNAFFIFLMKATSFLGITEKMKEIILTEFKSGESVDNRKTALFFYSQMCTLEEFSEATESYLPKQEKLGQGTEEDFDEIQILVPAMIKHVKPRCKNLQLILKFFLGDFLKIVLSSLYSCCYNTRCDVVIPFLKKRLEEMPPKVSYVKDIIRLVLALSDLSGRTEFCLEWWNKHKHYSVRSVVLRYVCQFFLEQRTQESFSVLEKCVLDCDEMTIEALPALHKIPREFMSEYVDTLWRFSETQEPNFKINFRTNLLHNLFVNNINFLTEELFETIIKNYLFDESSDVPINDFAAMYLTTDPEAMKNRAFVILDLIKHRKPDAQSVDGFFNILITKSLTKPSDFFDLFSVLLENWPQYPLGVLYERRVLFTYHTLYQKVCRRCGDGDEAAVEFGKELRKFYSSVVNLNDLLSIYVQCLKNFLEKFQTYKNILVLKELVAGSQERAVAVLAISSMPFEAVVWFNKKGVIAQKNIIKGRKELDEFVKTLEGYGDDVVEIYLRSKFEFPK